MCILFALVPTAVSGSGYCFCVVDYIMSFNSASFLILDFNVEIPVVMYSDFFFFFYIGCSCNCILNYDYQVAIAIYFGYKHSEVAVITELHIRTGQIKVIK